MNKINILLVTLMLLSSNAVATTESGPRGIRNNNPGNLVSTPIKWKGEVSCKDGHKTFECFRTPYHGIRAMAKTIKAYIEVHKKISFNDFFHRWAPAHENETELIIRFFESSYPEDSLLTVNLISFMEDLILLENGIVPYDRDIFVGVINQVFGRSSLLDREPYRYYYNTVQLEKENPVNSKATAGSLKYSRVHLHYRRKEASNGGTTS